MTVQQYVKSEWRGQTHGKTEFATICREGHQYIVDLHIINIIVQGFRTLYELLTAVIIYVKSEQLTHCRMIFVSDPS